MSGEDEIRRTVVRQERWIEERFGEDAADGANYGWGSDECEVATKVYGHGVLVTKVDGPHTWLPFARGGDAHPYVYGEPETYTEP
jgi:hypothetical protein